MEFIGVKVKEQGRRKQKGRKDYTFNTEAHGLIVNPKLGRQIDKSQAHF